MVLTTVAIDAIEGRDVAVIDAPGSFLTADMVEEVLVILENEMVNAMLEVYKEIYGKYVIHGKNKEKHMYVCLSKAMYGKLKEALLYYKKLSEELREYRFVKNPYNP